MQIIILLANQSIIFYNLYSAVDLTFPQIHISMKNLGLHTPVFINLQLELTLAGLTLTSQ